MLGLTTILPPHWENTPLQQNLQPTNRFDFPMIALHSQKMRAVLLLLSIALISCAEHLLDDPFELKYVMETKSDSFISISFASNKKAARILRFDDVKPGNNVPTYNFTVPVTNATDDSFFLFVSDVTIKGTFSKAAKAGGEGDQPFIIERIQEYNVTLVYPQDGTSADYKGHCCTEYNYFARVPNN